MRGLFIFGTFVVLVCSIYVSFNHTLELFMEGGYTGYSKWGMTIAAEVAFLMGVLSRFKARLKGTKPHEPANFMFWVGIAVVGWSNWNAGAAYGVQGIIKGLLVPIFVFGSEAVLAREYMDWWKEKKGISNESETIKQNADGNKLISKIKTISNKISGKKIISNNEIISGQNISRNETISNQNISKQTISNETVKLMGSKNREEASNNNVSEQNASLTNDKNISEQQIFSEKNISGNEDTNLMKNESVSLMENKTVSNESISDQSISNEIVREKTVSNETISNQNISNNQLTKPSNVVELSEHSKKRAKGRRKKVTPEEIERVKEIARQLLQENPRAGRYTLVEKAGCSHHVAQLVLDELKQSS